MQFFHEDSYLEEERFLTLGMSSNAKLLIVCHCERQQGLVIRIISARKASKQARKCVLPRWQAMKAEYDLSKLKSRKNSVASKLKKSVTMRLSQDVMEYFKGMADEDGVPNQGLINLYLRDCLANSRKVQINWPQGT